MRQWSRFGGDRVGLVLLRCMSQELAPSRTTESTPAMSALSPLSR
jgi:hypothetical protein